MLDIKLTAKPALNGYKHQTKGVSVTELTDISIVSVATPADNESALSNAAKSAFAITLPGVSGIEQSDNRTMRCLGLQPLQWFVVFDSPKTLESPVTAVKEQLGDNAYCTDQSDSWVTLELTGPQVLTALERICPLDLHPDSFTVGTVARTSMEHLGVVIARIGDDQYWLMSASSSAESFLHAITTSVKNVSL